MFDVFNTMQDIPTKQYGTNGTKCVLHSYIYIQYYIYIGVYTFLHTHLIIYIYIYT